MIFFTISDSKVWQKTTKSHKIVSSLQCGWYIEGHHFYGFTNSDDSNLCHFDLGWARVLEVDSRIKVDPGKFVKNDKLMPYPCSGSNFISNLVTNYIQKRRGEPGLFEYNLLPKLISK